MFKGQTGQLLFGINRFLLIYFICSEDILSRNTNNLQKKTDEQSALNKILQEFAVWVFHQNVYPLFQLAPFRNVIDVGALDSHNLQQNEYIERMRHYDTRVQHCNKSRLMTRKKCILQDIPTTDKILMTDPLSKEDIQMVRQRTIFLLD